jgi:hypothetical protein
VENVIAHDYHHHDYWLYNSKSSWPAETVYAMKTYFNTQNLCKFMKYEPIDSLQYDMLLRSMMTYMNSCLYKDCSDVYYINFVKKDTNINI